MVRPMSLFASSCHAFIAAVAAYLCLAGPVLASDPTYLPELIARSRSEGLAERRGWLTLLHYGPQTLGGVSSLIDGPSFFAAADGKTNPQAELEATLATFFAVEPAREGEQSPQCARIARFRWLDEQLQFDPARLDRDPCPAFDEWYRILDAAQITLVYPSAYLNNPSSMFGHTLLRIDRPNQSEQTRLLSFAVNFAADTGQDGGALFAIKGLAGGYRGYFSVLPYYEKVSQYSDIENRDIWEYQLNLKPAEIRRMLEHLWELDGQYVDYYFLTSNCSYILLSLINTARADLELMHGLDLYAIPVDTVRPIIRQDGMLKQAIFRPSGMTRIRHLREGLDEEGQALSLALADGVATPGDSRLTRLPPGQQATVLELAQSLVQYRLNTGELGRDVVAPRSLALLRARAAVPTPVNPPERAIEAPAVRPDEGHESARLSTGFGMTGSNPFIEVGLRPAYHDLLDPPAGYPAGAEIEILGFRIRDYYGRLPQLEQFTPVAIKSLSPRDTYFQPISWRLNFGVERFRDDGGDAGWLAGVLDGGAGGTWSLGGGGFVSALLGASLFADRDWPERRIAGAGPEVGLTWPITPWWIARAEARWQAVAGTDRLSKRYSVDVGQGFRLDQNLSLRIDASVRNDGGDAFGEWITSLQWYF